MSILADMGTIVTATLSGDINFKVVQAYRSPAAWYVFGPLTVVGAFLVLFLYKKIPWLDRHLERTIIVYTYIIIALIIFVGVIQRFVFSAQVPWSTTIPPLLFMIMAWYGCSYNVKLRTHLSFNEFRTKMGRTGQLTCLLLDNMLWFVFCIIVVTTTARVTVNTYDNFAIVLGTDNVMRWWFIVTMPICFVMMAGRVLENLFEDLEKYRNGEPLIEQAVIGGDV
ncbi:TRAP transporter small permease subunit [uncultured Roseobacter sp.]|uniref:TRAP transporter small permease n=1 Tax=uncultured Roseobacter sp. TaxID=114847 RepID=UPI00261D2974|nr:TRAP transporter small permease subunit [uncultured Roseobacter sp.]